MKTTKAASQDEARAADLRPPNAAFMARELVPHNGALAAIDMWPPLAAVACGLTTLGNVFLICANAAS
jgi:hypothetical protein